MIHLCSFVLPFIVNDIIRAELRTKTHTNFEYCKIASDKIYSADAGVAKMQKGLKPLKEIKDTYNKDLLNLLIGQMLNMPGIKNTKEIQRCFQRMAHEYAETNYPKILRKSTKCRRQLAPKLWQWFVGMYPKIADYFCGVEYKMSGGFGDPRGRYILTPKGEYDDWSGEWCSWPL